MALRPSQFEHDRRIVTALVRRARVPEPLPEINRNDAHRSKQYAERETDRGPCPAFAGASSSRRKRTAWAAPSRMTITA